MDIISQLQEQVNTIAAITFNAFGTLQRDAPPVQLSPNYPEPPATTTVTDDATPFPEQPKQLSAGLVKAAKQFDALVAALPLSEGGEGAQLKRIAELQVKQVTPICRVLESDYFYLSNRFVLFFLQVENDLVGQELQKQLEAAGKKRS